MFTEFEKDILLEILKHEKELTETKLRLSQENGKYSLEAIVKDILFNINSIIKKVEED